MGAYRAAHGVPQWGPVPGPGLRIPQDKAKEDTAGYAPG